MAFFIHRFYKVIAPVNIAFALMLLPVILCAQGEGKTTKKAISLKQDQLTLDIEFLSIGFAGTHAIGSRMGVGMGFQFGVGEKYILNNPVFLHIGEDEEGAFQSHQKLKSIYNFHVELIKVKLFWRYFFTSRSYMNAGIFASQGGYQAQEEFANRNIFSGFQIDLYTGFKKFKLGLKTQLGKSYMSYSSVGKDQFFLISITPALQVFF